MAHPVFVNFFNITALCRQWDLRRPEAESITKFGLATQINEQYHQSSICKRNHFWTLVSRRKFILQKHSYIDNIFW